jgi:hypothetical protein
MKRSLLLTLLISCSAIADPVWHCSRNAQSAMEVSASAQEDQFSLASFSSTMDVIGVSISDLIDVYSGVPVRIGGLPLSACFMPGNENLTSAALTSLGLQPAAIQALARRSAIIQSNLHIVTSVAQMLSCIARHFPAVGYLDEPHETQDSQPCF